MKSIKDKLNVLVKIANEFNNHNITWAIGGSLLLYLKNIVNNFNDIDIMIAEENIENVKVIMSKFGDLQPNEISNKHKTKYFLQYIVYDIEVDIMAGLSIIQNSKEFYFPLKEKDIVETISMDNTKLYLQSLVLWKQYYSLMDRPSRVKEIENYLNSK